MRRFKWNEWQQGLLAGVLLLVSLWLASLIYNLLGKVEVAVGQERQAKSAYQEIESRKAILEKNLSSLGTPRGQDAAIRQAFGVAKPGEEVIVVVPPAAPTTTPPVPWWRQVLDWF